MKFDIFLRIIILLSILAIPAAAGAEHIFLKDGRIAEGKILNETDENITLQSVSGAKEVIARNNILRTLFSDDYKTKMYIQMKTGEVVEGHIVGEDRTTYTVRKDLASNREFTYLKSKVTGTSRTKPGETKAPVVAITVRPAFVLPFLNLANISKYGTGGTVAVDWIGIAGTGLRLGAHGGFWYFFPASGKTDRHFIAPVSLGLGYDIAIAKWFSLMPMIDGGAAYSAITYQKNILMKKIGESFQPLVMAGLEARFIIVRSFVLGAGAQYGAIIEKSGVQHLVSFHVSIEGRF